ncbi:P-loop containing nucleoside triphosphate hydrolase protein [Lyophyllum atratum]|nr:P-loop containing nucleoside triphosphate hydrolase protein [Lyophyllum atratum]
MSTPIDRLTAEQKSLLKKGNLSDATEVMLSSSQEIARRCRVSTREAQVIIDVLYSYITPLRLRRLEDVKREGNETCTTGENILDEALGGGIRSGMVWEVAGESSAGKTQFGLQLSLFAQLPVEQRGFCGSTCYLTTSSTLPTTRLVQILEAHPSLSESDCGLKDVHTLATPTIPHLIHVLSVTLPPFIAKQANSHGFKPVKLLVVDALGELFHTSDKTTTNTLVERSKNIAQISALLHGLATTHRLAILVLNEVVDAFERDYPPTPADRDVLYSEQSRWFGRAHSIPNESKKEASLGLTWANQVNARIILSRTGRRRYLDDVEHRSVKRLKHDSLPAFPPSVPASRGDLTLIRRLSVIFSSVSRSVSLDYIVTEAGISILPGDPTAYKNEDAAPMIPASIAKKALAVSNPTTAPCSQISPLDIGIAEDRRSAAEEAAQSTRDGEPEEDEWDRYWASDEISADMYDKADLETADRMIPS